MRDAISLRLRGLAELTGKLIAWLMLPMVIGTFLIALLRYQFNQGWIWMQEAVVWMHAVVFMLAAAYTLNRDEHVRVDIFYRNMTPRGRARVDIAGTLLLLAPMSVFLIVVSWDYVAVSWAIREGSREAGGLPYPFVPLLKTAIPLASLLVLLQGAATVLSAWPKLCTRDPGVHATRGGADGI